jgi:shikimate kinase
MLPDGNIVLTGMPGAGKSTVGVLLAKRLGRHFLDTDVYIQAREERRLQDILEQEMLDGFRALEERYVLGLDCRQHVIATGGSVVYSPRAMAHLRRHGAVIYLHVPVPVLQARLRDLNSRGVVRAAGQTLHGLFAERHPLYLRYAHHVIRCGRRSHEEVLAAVLRAIAA